METMPDVQIEGVKAGEPIDIQAIRGRVLDQWHNTRAEWERKRTQTVRIDRSLVGIAWTADWHVGSDGTDYDRLEAELDIIGETPGLWCGFVGDPADNFVVAKLLQLRTQTRATIPDEYFLTGYYLAKIAGKLIAAVGGNHAWWTAALAGLDLFGYRLADIAPGCLYDPDEVAFTLDVGGFKQRVVMRHKWRGSSIYNVTHGQERGQLFAQDFDVAVGAHTHPGGYVRGFNAGGRSGYAVQCGAYKVVDQYARQVGYHHGNGSTSPVLLFDAETRAIVGVESLEMAAKVLRCMG